MSIKKWLAGSAVQFTLVTCGTTVTGHVAIISNSETLISSATYTESSTGYYYAIMAVSSTEGFYTAQHFPTVGTDAYGNAAIWRKNDHFQVILDEGGA
jgi:hypothetical protein